MESNVLAESIDQYRKTLYSTTNKLIFIRDVFKEAGEEGLSLSDFACEGASDILDQVIKDLFEGLDKLEHECREKVVVTT